MKDFTQFLPSLKEIEEYQASELNGSSPNKVLERLNNAMKNSYSEKIILSSEIYNLIYYFYLEFKRHNYLLFFMQINYLRDYNTYPFLVTEKHNTSATKIENEAEFENFIEKLLLKDETKNSILALI